MPTPNLMGATSSLPQILVSSQLNSTAETNLYQGPVNSSVKIAHALVSNPTASAATIAISAVKAGGTAGTTNRVLPTYTLAAGDALDITKFLPQFLGPGDFISAQAGTSNAINFELDGAVFS